MLLMAVSNCPTDREVPAPPAPPEPPRSSWLGPVRRLYDWVLSWADHPAGTWALFLLAVAESSFFPIPPDVLLIALVLGRPSRAMWLATVCTAGSVLGGALGYLIGWQLWDLVGEPIFRFYGVMDKYAYVQEKFQENAFAAIAIAGFTPIPYKVFTIAAGAMTLNFGTFISASILSRGARFFLVAGLLRLFGKPMKAFIDRYFDVLTLVFTVLLIGGFVVVKQMAR
jgi:membrane protein YqaA with SNARE-associated domain